MKKIILAILIQCMALPVFADFNFEYTYEGQTLTYYCVSSSKTCELRKGTNNLPGEYYATAGNDVSGDLIIPEQIFDGTNYYTVTRISKYAFVNLKNLTSVQIPGTITVINDCAFYGCIRLKEVTIKSADANRNIWIDSKAFGDCVSLTSFVFQNTSGTIETGAFTGCSSLKKVVKPSSLKYDFANAAPDVHVIDYAEDEVYFRANGVIFSKDQTQLLYVPLSYEGDYSIRTNTTAIGPSAFAGCSKMTSVTIPNSVTSIGASAFYGCSGLETVEIPSSINEIDDLVFKGCSGMKSLTLPNTISTIGKTTFSECEALAAVTIPESVTAIDSAAFSGCKAMATLKIGGNVESIGESAFSGCSSLTSLSIPHSVKTLGNKAFYDCTGLATIRLTDGITSLGDNVWDKCAAVKDVVYTAQNPITASNTIFDPVAYDEATLHVPPGTVNTYMSAVPWNYFLEITDNLNISGIDDITEDSCADKIDYSKPYHVYSLLGIRLGESVAGMAHGIYLIRQGATTVKIWK